MPAWAPDGRAIVYVTWTNDRRTHQARACRGRRAADAHGARGLLPRSRVHARRRAASRSWPARPPISSTRSCSTRRRPITTGPTPRGRDRRHRPAEHARDPHRCRPPAAPQTLVAVGAGRTRTCTFTRGRSRPRLLHDQPRAAVGHAGRLRPPHAPARAGRGPGQQPAGRRRDSSVARRHARVRQPAGPASHRRRAARRTRDRGSAHPGPRRQRRRAGDAHVDRGRRLPATGRATAPP